MPPDNESSNARTSHSSDEKEKKEPGTSVDEEATAAPWRSLFYFTTRRSVPILSCGLALSAIGGLVSPATSRFTGRLFDDFTSLSSGSIDAQEFIHNARTNIYYLLAIAGFSWIVNSLDFACWLSFGELQAKSARDQLFQELLEKDMHWYDGRKNGVGALLPRLQAQVRELQLGTAQPLGILATAISTAVLCLAQAFAYSWNLTLVTLSTAPLVMVLVMWAGRGSQENLNKQTTKLTEAQKFCTSALTAMETVKCFNGQAIEEGKYTNTVREAARWYYRVVHANATEMALITLLSVSMFVQGFYYGSILVRHGTISVGHVITTFTSAVYAFVAISSILPQMIVLEKGRAAGATLRAVISQIQNPDHSHRSTRFRPAACLGDIAISHLTFAYPARADHAVLMDVTMSIPGGEMTFLIGKSGSGKSTIGQLLMQFYSAHRGNISLDGNPFESLDVSWLRANVTLVEQTSVLFNDSIYQNIAFGRHDQTQVTRDEAMAAAEFALLQQTINDMAHGLDTKVGSRGGALSGGQRQRVALARARLRDTPILILDESTSALDAISRSLMMEAIRRWRRGKTTIVITHDISQILAEDYVFVLEHGRLVQQGYRKHMERLKGTPFHSFVNEGDGPHISSLNGLRAEDPDLGSPRTLCNSPVLEETHGSPNPHFENAMGDDPIEARLSASHEHRLSRLPQVFREGGPQFGMPAPVQGVTNTNFASPWMRLAKSPPSPPLNAAWSTPSAVPDSWSQTAGNDKLAQHTDPFLRNHRYSQLTNIAAAVADPRPRSTVRPRARRPVGSDMDWDPEESVKDMPPEREKGETQRHPQQSLWQIMATLWPTIAWKPRLALVGGFCAATLHGISSPVASYLLAKLVDTYTVPGGDAHLALVYSMIMLALAFMDALSTYLYRMLLEYAGQCWVDGIRAEAMKRILDQPRAFFDEEDNGVSRLTDNLDRNAEEMRNLLGRFCGLAYVAAILVIGSIGWAMVAQWKLTLITLSTGPIVYLATRAFAVVSVKWEGICNSAAEETSAIFTETFTSIKTVRSLTLEKHFSDKYVASTSAALKLGFKRSIFSGLLFGLSDSAGNFVVALMFYIGALVAKNGEAPVARVVQVVLQLIFAVTNVSAILDYIPQISSSKDMATRLLRLSQLPIGESHEHQGDTRISSVGDIVFDGVDFAYPSRPGQTVLRDLNLHFQPGTCTAIVGGSGSGKSTIANLLLNLYPAPSSTPNRGNLLVSGRKINRISTSSLRSLVVPVPQTPTLFAASILDNITYGLAPTSSPAATLALATDAARQAGIHDFVASLPAGYATLVGEGGLGLSGGQAQRLAIARPRPPPGRPRPRRMHVCPRRRGRAPRAPDGARARARRARRRRGVGSAGPGTSQQSSSSSSPPAHDRHRHHA